MKRTFLKQLFCLSCCAVIGLSASPVFAAEASDSPSSVINPERTGTIVIDYQDMVDGNDPITNAEFTFYKVADLNMQITAGEAADLSKPSVDENAGISSGTETKTGSDTESVSVAGSASVSTSDTGSGEETANAADPGTDTSSVSESSADTVTSVGNQYVPVIPGLTIDQNTDAKDIAEKVQTYYKEHPETAVSYTGKTGSDGKLAITGMQLGVYLGMETSPAREHYASTPFLFQLPYSDGEGVERTFWNYELTVEPKALPAGDLIVSKQVKGTAGDTSKEFHFKVEFKTTDDSLAVPYEISNGKKGTIRTGETIPLKSGEIATITMIPCGSNYEVTEAESNQDGYKTTTTGTSGHITRKTQAKAAFVNSRDKVPTPTQTPTPTGDNLPILYAVLAVVSVCVIGIVLFISHRRKKK